MGTAGAEQLRQRLAQGLAARPVLREALRALGAGGFSLVLAGAGLLSAHVPLALAPVCVLPFGPAAVCAYLGAVAGYAVFWGLSAALEPVAAGFLMLAGSCLFRDLLPAQRRGFVPAAAGGIYALLGLIFVLQADGGIRAALLLALRLTLLVVSIRALCPAEETARLRPYAAAVCLLAGLVRVELPFGVPLSVVGAAAVCLLVEDAQDALLIGAACRAGARSREPSVSAADGLLLPAASCLPDGGPSPDGAGGGVCGTVFSVRARLGRGARGLDAGRAGRRGFLVPAPRLCAAGCAAGRACCGQHAGADGGCPAADGDKAVSFRAGSPDGPGADL